MEIAVRKHEEMAAKGTKGAKKIQFKRFSALRQRFAFFVSFVPYVANAGFIVALFCPASAASP
jgi:hypothetical protein